MIVFLALLAAFVYACGVVLQQRAALEAPLDEAAKPRLLVRLVRRPLWLLGLAADVGGFGLQAAALHRGSLVVVQPIITTSLVFALVLTSAWTHEPISRRQWTAVVLILAGLAVFLIVASPNEESSAVADMRGWILTTATITAAAAIALGAGLRAVGTARVALFAIAAGIADAFMAVLAKAFSGSFDRGLAATFQSWTPYALVVGGLVAMLLISTAYQAGHPTVSLPIITVTDPLVASLIGISLFGDELRLDGVRGPLVVLALAVMAAGLLMLSRDSQLANEIAGTSQPAAGGT
ncbi:MAG TPA: DMT family transporter [Acidimicrobiales bacterium]|nr:DMT family transporter [Acidimicrobiales bacterium]